MTGRDSGAKDDMQIGYCKLCGGEYGVVEAKPTPPFYHEVIFIKSVYYWAVLA